MTLDWIDMRRRRRPLQLMTREHIQNCIAAIKRGAITRHGCSGFDNNQWLRIFETELQRRNRRGL